MAITAEQVKKLREATGAGMMECKNALGESAGDFDKAVVILRKKGLAAAAKRPSASPLTAWSCLICTQVASLAFSLNSTVKPTLWRNAGVPGTGQGPGHAHCRDGPQVCPP